MIDAGTSWAPGLQTSGAMMTKHLKKIATAFVLACALPLAGCPDRDGPMEKAGEKIDEAAEDVSDSVDEAVDDLQEE